MLSPSAACYAILREYETCKLVAYPDPGSDLAKAMRLPMDKRPAYWWMLKGDPWTNGWGATGPGIVKGVVWSQQKADDRLILDTVRYGTWVSKLIHFQISQQAFDALTSLVFNIGPEAFAGSTMHRLMVPGYDPHLVAAEFPKWDHSHHEELEGLLRRRKAEQALFLSPSQPASIS